MSISSAFQKISPDRVSDLMSRELEAFDLAHPRSRTIHEQAGEALLSGVPMNWMTRWPGSHPVFFEEAKGNHLTDVDGNRMIDFCLGDTGAMTGHSPEPTVAAASRRLARGITTMLPSEDALPLGLEMKRRFGLDQWQFSLSASDANRFSIRLCREITGRDKVLVFNHCYHGSVDETVARLVDGEPSFRVGNIGPPVPISQTTRVVEFNDFEGLERELAQGDVACVLAEPALTNIGIVLPEPGYLDALRRLTRENGTLLIIDETHTFCCGPGGYTKAHGLEPDLITIGKPIAGGVPTGAYGMTTETAERVLGKTVWEAADVGGVGGTLAGNALSLAAARATLESVLTDEAFEHMIEMGIRFEEGVQQVIDDANLAWTVTRLGCRAEYMLGAERPKSGQEAADAFDIPLDALLHLYMLNRGILMTPFHMMALMCPDTEPRDVDAHTAALAGAAAELVES
ncbi:MAG: aminotransferase class III-fold pyridoxal phosphate-dependent enzyme [Solirubrobacterales bacterium]|mgnify:CR=1 FL=1|nr:aminotransferase class III-fold pyridoxal phosphate-dependent enzyme [Solirubrobacterales bacterium]HMT04168.1 transaminase [Solirubrobacterales bacterium]